MQAHALSVRHHAYDVVAIIRAEFVAGWWLTRWLVLADIVLLALLDGSSNSTSSLATWVSIDRATTLQLLVVACMAVSHARQCGGPTRWILVSSMVYLTLIAMTAPHLQIANSLRPFVVASLGDMIPATYAAKMLALVGVAGPVLATILIAGAIANTTKERFESILLMLYIGVVGTANLATDLVEAWSPHWVLESLVGGAEYALELLGATFLVGCYACRLMPTRRQT